MKKILVPTDFSPIAANAANYALAVASNLNAEIVFFHANEHIGSDEQNKLKAQVSNACALNPSLKADFVATDKLFNSLTIADLFGNSIDLIVMGTSGEQGDLSKKVFGTNAEGMIDNLSCPLLVVPSHHASNVIKQIAYASDLNNLDNELAQVIPFARAFNAAIEVFHVSPVFPDLGDVEKMDAQSKVDSAKAAFSYSTIHYSAERMKRDNQVTKGIEHFLSNHKSDLLVLFHANLEGLNRFFTSSTSEKAVYHLKNPLLIFPKAN